MHAQTAASNFLVDPSQLRYEPDEKKLGEGAFAKVRKATFNNKVVAVKTLKFAMSSTSSKFEARAGKLFLEEADKMSQISHEHIVAFLGFINTTDTKSIILEYVPGGSLHTLLHCGAQSVRWLDKFWVARDIADGMTYLHSKTTQEGNQKCDVFHQDLKADNILLYTSGNCEHDQQLRAKIADFGLSVMRKKVSDLKNKKTSIVGGTRTSSKTKSGSNSKAGYYLSFVKHIGGTPAYMAPELETSNKFTKACDVYAFGVILVEMATNEPPQEAMVMYKAKLGRRSIPKCFADMAKFCVEPMPRNRPRFKVMLEFLETQVLKKTLVAANTTNTSVEKEEKKNSSEMVDNSTGGEGLGDETHGAERTKKKIVMDDQAFIKLLASVPAFNPSTSSKDQQKMPGNAIYGDLEAELFGETRGGHQAPQLALGGRGEGLRLGLGAGGGGGASVRSSNAAKVNQHLKPPSAAEGKSDAYSYQTTNYEAQTTPRSEQQQRQQECEEDIDITSNSWLKSEFASEKKDVSLEWDDDDDEGRENKNSTRFKHLCRCIIL